jgi:DNA-binding transcriptional regulator GbsR (MarR family)
LHRRSTPLKAEELQFIKEVAALFEPWGWPAMHGRVYGYLLLHHAPVSLNRIASDLGISKVAAWNAAKALESFEHVRRHGDPGSKRALYGPSDHFHAPVAKQRVLLGSLATLLDNSATTLASAEAAPRLQEMAQFYASMGQAIEATIEQLNTARAKKR